MRKIYDSFLFFQELDLLEIRLEYLNPFVDYFVIVESCQTFSGKRKNFVFEENVNRYSKYLNKIIYHKIEDFHESYESITSHLKSSDSEVHDRIGNILDSHHHYSKNELHWLLDSYHRECIHFPLDKYAKSEDIIFLSDLDEIPNISLFNNEVYDEVTLKPFACQQKEFKYYLNYYDNKVWIGTVAATWADMQNYSLNVLRIDSKESRNIINKNLKNNGGYHFTSCGGAELLVKKIQSWGHQEFNNEIVIRNLETNISRGLDIFFRESKSKLKFVSIDDESYFDNEMASIIQKYDHLTLKKQAESIPINLMERLKYKLFHFLIKAGYKIKRLFRND